METNKRREGGETSPESAFKLWGEEKNDDCIYSVYLKKVSYKKSADETCVEHECCQDSRVRFLSYLQWETVRIRTIKAASVERLVGYLPVAVEEMDSVYINVFFSTYQTFTTLRDALEMLITRYIDIQETAAEAEQDRHLKNIRSVVMMWLDESMDDFREPPNFTCLRMIEEFARDVSHDVELQLRAQLMLSAFLEELSPKKSYPEQPKFQFSVCDEVDFMMLGTMGFHDIREIDSQLLAEQLTQVEADLFRKVIPQHCLGSIWSRRDKKRGVEPTTVSATVEQFNDLTMKVMSTILEDKELRPMARGLIITKWIDVAQACRELKNFSSLKAIISALQSHPIHRLRRAWSAVPKANMILFEDLANIFLDDNNFEAWREIINKEGTAKFATVSPRNSKKTARSLRKMMSSDKMVVQRRESWHGKVNGTVPYLGTFLTDLIKIDTAHPDTVEGGLINFEKKRKEFEVIAQIRLLQMASKSYQILPHDKFLEWYNNVPVLSYHKCCDLSDDIENPNILPSSAPPTPTLPKTDKPKMYRKFFSFTAEDYRPHASHGTTALPNNANSNSSNALGGHLGMGLHRHRRNNRFVPRSMSHHPDAHRDSSRGRSPGLVRTDSGDKFNMLDPGRVRIGPGAKNHSSTSSISSSSSSTPSSDDSLSIASIDNHLPASSTPSSTSSTASSGSTSLSMSTTSSSTESRSRESSLLSVESSPAKSRPVLKPSLSMTCLPTLNRQQSSPLGSSSSWSFPSESCRIIRVGLDEGVHQEEDGNIYRSLVITHQEHTPSVIKSALIKHHMPESCDHHDYELIQLFDDKELLIPSDANVFYAMNTSGQPHFLLRKKPANGDETDSSPKKKSVRSKNSKRLHIKRMSWVKVRDENR